MESSKNNNESLGAIGEALKELNNNSNNISEIEKKYFEEDNNLIDYFVEVGVNPDIFKYNILYSSDSINDINANIIPHIITKFPKIDKKYIVIESTIIQQIFPQGFNAVETEEKPDSEFYSIILDNQLYSAKYTHKYFACLLIYESLKDYEKLNLKYKSKDILANLVGKRPSKINDNKKKYKNYYIPKCLCLVSVYPFFTKFEKILRAIYDLTLSDEYNNLYIDRIIEKLIVEIPKLPRGYKKIHLKLPNKIIDLTERRMNDYPKININLSKLFGTLKMDTIIEIFRYLLFETKMIFFSSKLYDLTNTIMSILTLITPFKYQFQVVSVLPKELYNFIENISPFIFGINESYNDKFFEKNNITLEDTTICVVDIDQDKYKIISVSDKGKNEEIPDFPKYLKEKIEKDYNNYIQELINQARDVSIRKTEYEDNNNSSISNISINNQDVKEDNKMYQQIFFDFMIFLLKDYPNFLSKDYGVTKDISMSVKDMIDTEGYLNSLSENERNFYKRIFNTQMFIEFIFKRMMPKDCTEKVEILFFEEKINEKFSTRKIFGKSKAKEENILLTSKEYHYDKEAIVIDCSSDVGITDAVYEYYIKNEKKAEKDFLNKGYDIEVDKKNNKILFKYHIFPSLLSDKFFNLNYKYYKIPEQYYKHIDIINAAIVNKSHLKFNNKELTLTEMGNDLYLCYLIIWALTLWYTDTWEREFRFLKMIEIIEKVERHDIEIFELLFKAIVNYCNDKDTVLLYKKFIHLNLNPTWSIFSLVSKIIKKKSNIKNKKELLSQQTKFEELKTNKRILENKTKKDIITFRSRTLKLKDIDDNILSEDLFFYAYGYCKYCNDHLNLKNLCSDLSQLKTKSEKGKDFFKCPNKHTNTNKEYIQLKLNFSFGVELFNLKLQRNKTSSTSKNYVIELLSPSTIKKKLLKIVKELGDNKFNVEMFKKNYKEIFWNLVWFFEINDMDVSFMLPYCEESSEITNDTQSENIKKSVIVKNRKDKDIDIEKMVKYRDLKVSIIFYGKAETLNDKIDKDEIKNNIFTDYKQQYLMSDLTIQKIYQLYISDKTGMVSYMGFDTFSDNIGYNEYPVQFEVIEIPGSCDSSPLFSFGTNSLTSLNFDFGSLNDSSSSFTINKTCTQNKSSSFNQTQNVFVTKKLVNFEENDNIKGTATFQIKKKGGGILKRCKNIVSITTNVEVKPIEDIDFLAKFQESQTKIGNELKPVNKDNNFYNLSNDIDFRKSTLKKGILSENDNYFNEYYEEE